MNDLPTTTDVVIVGGGFAGCATGWALARRGVRSIVLEREPELGRFASGRGAGLGRQLAEDDATSRLAIRGAAILRENFSAAWSSCGGILSFDDASVAQAYIARAARLGVPHEVIDRAGVLAAWPALTELPIVTGLRIAGDGVIDVRGLLAMFAADLDIVFNAPALACDRGRVTTPRGTITARVVVDATGAWAGSLVGDPPLETFKRHLFVVEAAPPPAAPYFWHLGATELYMRADASGLVVSPCDGEPVTAADEQPAADADGRLRARLGRAAPPWASTPIARRWACQRSFAPDRQMRLGRDPERPWLVWAAALGGHGATASPAVGEVVADAVVEALR